nr:MAG TPA: Queuine tRNA-ribosyltransferase catalytic subunit 1, queuine, tRNA, TRANSFERASE [Caudoviricetes sp.]
MTDGDYALVNLFAEDEEYYQMFKDAVREGREVILDNGVFELGEAWNADQFAGWVDRLQPTYYIVPDVLEKGQATIESFFNFIGTHKGLPGKVLGVVQGENMYEFIRCYKAIEPYCDKVGISFDCSWYRDDMQSGNKWEQLAGGRLKTLIQMDEAGIINRSKPHHLLGVSLPQEMQHYKLYGWKWIDSVDTSNPVVHGLKYIVYSSDGLHDKETQKLYTLINAQVDSAQLNAIVHNIKQFRRFCNEMV